MYMCKYVHVVRMCRFVVTGLQTFRTAIKIHQRGVQW